MPQKEKSFVITGVGGPGLASVRMPVDTVDRVEGLRFVNAILDKGFLGVLALLAIIDICISLHLDSETGNQVRGVLGSIALGGMLFVTWAQFNIDRKIERLRFGKS